MLGRSAEVLPINFTENYSANTVPYPRTVALRRWMTNIRGICPGRQVIRDNRTGFGVRNLELSEAHMGQRGIRVIEIWASRV